MSYFNPNELLVNKALAFGVYPYVNAPEAHLYLAKQMWEEANHCVAFEYVLETFPIDRQAAYAAHVETPSMAMSPRVGRSSSPSRGTSACTRVPSLANRARRAASSPENGSACATAPINRRENIPLIGIVSIAPVLTTVG